jgi:transcriptional regulator with XRE-family HTH domain
MHDNSTFGQWLKQRRKSLDLTQQEVAQRAQCATETVRKLEAGSRRASRAVAHALATALELEGSARAEFLRLARIAPSLGEPGQSTLQDSPAQSESAPLLATKLFIPHPRTHLVARPRLLARLEAGVRGPLTLIAAPAGFGKTTVLADWLSCPAASPRHVAWLALDAGDSNPIQFLRYLITALQTLASSIGTTPPAPSRPATAAGAVADRGGQRPRPFARGKPVGAG